MIQNVSILRRFTRLDVCERNLALLGPLLQVVRNQFRPIIHANLTGTASPGDQHLQYPEMTRSAGKEVSTSFHKASRLKSSWMFKVRKAMPLAKLSLMKSNDQLWLALAGWTSSCGIRLGNLFLGFIRSFLEDGNQLITDMEKTV